MDHMESQQQQQTVAIIRATDVTFAYLDNETEQKGIPVLEGLSLSIRKGEMVALLGHNGCGKSTIAKHFNSILIPDAGDVVVDGINTKDEERVFDVRRRVGMVFQNPDNQLVATIVEEDVAFGLENIGAEPKEIRHSRRPLHAPGCDRVRRADCHAGSQRTAGGNLHGAQAESGVWYHGGADYPLYG